MDSKATRHSSLITSWSFQVCFYLVPRAFPMEIKNSIILGKSPGDEVDEDRRGILRYQSLHTVFKNEKNGLN